MARKTESQPPPVTAKPVDTTPKISVTETVDLALVVSASYVGSNGYERYYHQTATTAHLLSFVSEIERRLGRDHKISIDKSGLSASRKEAVR